MHGGAANSRLGAIDVSSRAISLFPHSFSLNAQRSAPLKGPERGERPFHPRGKFFSRRAVRFGLKSTGGNVVGVRRDASAFPRSAISGAVKLTAYFRKGWNPWRLKQFFASVTARVGSDFAKRRIRGRAITIYILGQGCGSNAGGHPRWKWWPVASVQKVESRPAFPQACTRHRRFRSIEYHRDDKSLGRQEKRLSCLHNIGKHCVRQILQYMRQDRLTRPEPSTIYFSTTRAARAYLSATDHVDVFDMNAQVFRSPRAPPPNGPREAGLRGMALTAETTPRLIVADVARKV